MFDKNSYKFTLWVLLLAFFVQAFFDPLGTGRAKHHDDLLCDASHEGCDDASSSLRYKKIALDFVANHRFSILMLLVILPFSVDLFGYFFLPLHVTKTVEDVEQQLEGPKYKGKRPRRSIGQLPPPYPNAWFKVMNGWELEVGEVKDVELLGQQFVIYRGKNDGKVHMLDAYCPHMGAHLGIGGTVIGDELACPFHGWQFQHDGKCTKIPYADTIPVFPSNIRSWTTAEVNGAIYVWHDAEGREPQWEVPVIKQISDGSYRFHGSSTHIVRAHIQEIPENGADTAHLNWLHLPIVLDWPILRQFAQHTWSATWEEGKGIEQHLAFIKLRHGVLFCGKPVPGTFLDVHITQVGPSSVQLTFMTAVGRVIVIETVTPIQPLIQRATHQVYAEKHIPRFIAKFILRSLIFQFEKDVPIWNNKTFTRSPWVVKQDGPISKYRRWFARNFYSENSEKVAMERRKDTAGTIDW